MNWDYEVVDDRRLAEVAKWAPSGLKLKKRLIDDSGNVILESDATIEEALAHAGPEFTEEFSSALVSHFTGQLETLLSKQVDPEGRVSPDLASMFGRKLLDALSIYASLRKGEIVE
jgi:hypothetical protein